MTGNKKQQDFLNVIKDSRPRWALIAGFMVLFVTIQIGMTPSRSFDRLRTGSLSIDPPVGTGKRQPRDPRG